MNAGTLRRRVAQLRDAPVHGLRHAPQLVRVGLPVLLQASVRDPLVEGLCFDELLLPPAEKRIDIEAGIHLAELPQHLRLVPTLEWHHLPLWTLSSRPAGGLAEAHRPAECGDLLEEELLVVADFPALPAQREDDGGLGVVLLAESRRISV